MISTTFVMGPATALLLRDALNKVLDEADIIELPDKQEK